MLRMMFYFRSMSDWLTPTPRPNTWPRPPAALPAARLNEPSQGARVCVAGLVLVRQRPGTAKGVIFLTLEDETGVANVVVWAAIYERFRRAVISGRLLRVTGRLQRDAGVVHVVAEGIEDMSPLLDRLLAPDFRPQIARAADQP
jgi:DNA polymerase III alpha subunit